MLLRLTRAEAESMGLLTCNHCSYPRNNHFPTGKKLCAHDSSCPGYEESARVGKIVKQDQDVQEKLESLKKKRAQFALDPEFYDEWSRYDGQVKVLESLLRSRK